MKKLTPIEWQSFSLKKDIETIIKKLPDSRLTQISLIGEISLVILSVALTKIFTCIVEQKLFWIGLIVMSLAPFFILLMQRFIEELKKNKPGFDRIDAREFINTFDNEIAYYILMSDSYCSMLTEALSQNDTHVDKTSQNMLHFYYIQASYYFKKAIYDLVPLNNIVDKVISPDINKFAKTRQITEIRKIASRRLISYPRYVNAKNLLVAIYEYLKTNKFVIKDIDEDEVIYKLNEHFKDILDCIHVAVGESRKKQK